MATFLNYTADDLNLPEFGLAVKAGDVVETDVPELVHALTGHPHFDLVEPSNTVDIVDVQAQVQE